MRKRDKVLAFLGLNREQNPDEKVRAKVDPHRWFGESDIDGKAKDYIDKVHHKMGMGWQDVEAEEYIDKMHHRMNRSGSTT